MNHHPTKNVLLDYLSAEVSPSQKKLLQGHLAGCERCQAEIDRLSLVEERVQNFLRNQAASAVPGDGAWERLQVEMPVIHKPKKAIIRGFKMSKAVPATFLTTLLLVLSLLLAVPAVRAQIEKTLIQWFQAEVPGDAGTVAWGGEDWPFTPYTIAYFPEGYDNKGTTSGIIESPDNFSLTLTYHLSDDRFIKVINSQGIDYTDLPEGEPITIAGQPAALNREPYLEEILFGEVDDIQDYAVYEAFQFTWFMEDVQIEVVSNFPLEEILRIAGSIKPMEAGDAALNR